MKNSDSHDGAELVPVLPGWSALHSIHYQFLDNQQNMLEDEARTGAYHRGITLNRADFEGRTVLDVGAGTGILSLFAAQAGARKVYAVEGTESSGFAQRLAEHNGYQDRIQVIQQNLTELTLPEKVDVVISEPWGFFLFHERMVETYVFARDRFMKPGGKLFPSNARLWLAPFSDHGLFEGRTKSLAFWDNEKFFGVDLSGLADIAAERVFEMPIVGYFEPHMLRASPVIHAFDFRTMPLAALAKISLPFKFMASQPGVIHGLAGWFDVFFDGSQERVKLTTAPDAPKTHWMQMRFLLAEPVSLSVGQTVEGTLTLVANAQSSYTAHLEIEFEDHPVQHQTFHLHAHFWWGNG